MKTMMRTLTIVIPIGFVIVMWGELTGQEMSREAIAAEIQRHFANPTPPFAFVKDIAGEGDLTKLVNTFFNENFFYVDYLSRESKSYREGLVESVCAFLEGKGNKITGHMPAAKPPTAIHDVKAIAVRHVYPIRTDADGKIGTLICASALGFKDYPERNAPVEAFTFQAVFNEIKKDDSFILARVREYGKLARSLNLSSDQQDLLKRAQGIHWILLYQDPKFEGLLLEAYSGVAAILPFRIVNN